jgi:hypothetical protein
MDLAQNNSLGRWGLIGWSWNNIPYDIPRQVTDLKTESIHHQIEPHISLYYFENKNPLLPLGMPKPDPNKYPRGRSDKIKPTEPGKYAMIIVSDAEERVNQIYLERNLTHDEKTVIRTKTIVFEDREIIISLINPGHQMFKLYY